MNFHHPLLQKLLEREEKRKEILHVFEEVDPDLEMSHIHLLERKFKNRIVFFHKIKNCKYRAVSNLFGEEERGIRMMEAGFSLLKNFSLYMVHPQHIVKKPWSFIRQFPYFLYALPVRKSFRNAGFEEIQIQDLPLIRHWPEDGGAFVTLPQVYSEDPEKPGIWNSNLGMYRIQLDGNEYIKNKEVGLHYQLHRGIGVHHSKAVQKKTSFKVSVFVGGPPAHTFSAVMPLPEGMPEICMAGLLARRRFRYDYVDGWLVSLDADFVILGEVDLEKNKPEGPFGDHFGYYSLVHPFPYMKVHKVFAKPHGIWPFTVVGRPPQEDMIFGHLIHEITAPLIAKELPGVKAIHAVDAAGVHPLLLAIGSERYTPYLKDSRPSEMLTQAFRILGTGQLSLAKFLIMMEFFEGIPHPYEIKRFFNCFLERVDTHSVYLFSRTTIDTLDYSGDELNRGSKMVFLAGREVKRTLTPVGHDRIQQWFGTNAREIIPGIWCLQFRSFSEYNKVTDEINEVRNKLKQCPYPLPVWIVLCDGINEEDLFTDFLWITFTRCNPARDVHGFEEILKNKEIQFTFPLIFDARIKPHHAPVLTMSENVVEKIKKIIR
jgi:4-hydroxy-3-polyprenylbenzoate decarboxylase